MGHGSSLCVLVYLVGEKLKKFRGEGKKSDGRYGSSNLAGLV